MEQNIRFTTIGRRSELPASVLAEIDENIRLSQGNSGMTLCLAINYGSRAEITDAVRAIAEQVRDGRLRPDQITEEKLTPALTPEGVPKKQHARGL